MMQDTEYIEKLIDAQSKRIDKIESTVENIQDLTISVKEIAVEMKAMRKDQNDMNVRLKAIEEKPAKNWDNLIQTIITRYWNRNTGLFYC